LDSVATTCYPLVAIVCGFEKSGTTVVNEILRRHPRLDSGHEVGVLLASSPRAFPAIQPYFAFFQQTWKLSKEQASDCCDTDDWAVFYSRARAASPVIVDKTVLLFDKTPRYMRQLSTVMDRVPELPCVINVRDPRALMHSWACWSGFRDAPGPWLEQHFESNCERFLDYARGYAAAARSGRYRLLLNQFETMCIEPEQRLRSLFEFLGFEFSPAYLNFHSEHFVYGHTVTREHLFPYRQDFSEALCQRILDATAEFADWHFHG
jgi:hypothetical protein